MLEYLLKISSIVEPIFTKVAYMSIVATLVGLVIFIIKKVCYKSISPRWISRIWIIFIISLIIPIQLKSSFSVYNIIPITEDNFSYSVNRYIENENNINSINDEENDIKFIPKMTSNEIIGEGIISPKYNIKELIPIFWGAIVCAMILSYMLTYCFFVFKIRDKIYENSNIVQILKKAKEKLNLKTNITVVKQDIIKMPALFGVFNPRILINDNVLNLSNEEIEYVFLHELSHYKRKDNLFNILITFLKCIYFFNPLIYILLNNVKDDLELATDEMAMENESQETQKQYSKTLVKLSIIDSDKFLIQTLCVSDGKKNLERRIDSMKLLEKFKNKKLIISIIAIILILFTCLIFLTKSKNYVTYEEIIKLTSKIYELNNLTIEWDTFENDRETMTLRKIYYDNKVEVIVEINEAGGEEISEWSNIETGECYEINDEMKTIQRYSGRVPLLWDEHTENGELGMLRRQGYKYEYLGKQLIDGQNTYKIKFSKYGNEYFYYINIQNGLLMKLEKRIILEGNESIILTNFYYKTNELDDDVTEKIDLDDYKDYRIIVK